MRGTKAAGLPDQVSETVKKQRSRQLHELADELKLQFCRDNLGNAFPVLWEAYRIALDGGKQRVFGYTPNYLRVGCVIDADESVENRTIPATLSALGDGYVAGEMLHS